MNQLIRTSFAALILLFFFTDSQGGLNTYTFSQSSGTYTAVTKANILVGGVMEFPVRLPFHFRVDTVSSDSLFININGYAALRKDPTMFQNPTPQPLASNRQYDGVMAPFATNLYPGFFPAPSGAIRLDTTGTAPNRIFTVDWQNKQSQSGGYTLSFQLRLHETTNIVDFVYGAFTVVTGGSSSLSGQIGLRCVDTGYLSGGITGVTNVQQLPPSSFQYLAWTAPIPLTAATNYSLVVPGSTPPIKPASGLTYTFTPAPACSASLGAGLLTDSTTVCYGSTVLMQPTGTPDSLLYQWQSSTDNGATWNNFNGGFGGNYLTAVSAPVTGTILYRQKATCLKTSGISYTNATKLKHYPALSLPYYEGFEGTTTAQPLPPCMIATPATAAGSGGSPAHTGTKAGRYGNYAQGWFITPGLNLLAGKTYRFTTWYYGSGSSGPDTLRLAIGTYPHPDSLTTTFAEIKIVSDYTYRRATHTFTVPASGRYFAGIRWSGGSNYSVIDDIGLYEVPAQDATVDTFVYPLPTSHTCFSAATPVTIRVRNTGQDTIRNVPVSYSLNNVKYGPETIATPIPPGGDLAYTFIQKANLTGIFTTYTFRAWSALPGDGAIANDTSYIQTLRTDTLKAVPYTQTFDGIFSLSDIKWYNPFPNPYSTLYRNYSWKNTSLFFYWSLNAMPVGSKDSISSTPFGPIHANTFMMFDYRVMDFASTPGKQMLNAGDTMFVVATTDCGTSRDTLMKIHAGNQYYSDSFKTTAPVFIGGYAGNTIRIGFVMKKNSTNTTTAKYFHLDNFKLVDMKLHDIALVYLEPRAAQLICFGASVPVKLVIRNDAGFSETGFPIKLQAGTASTPIISYTYTGTLNYGQSDTVNLGLVTPASKGPLSLKAYISVPGDTTLRNDSLSTNIYTVDTTKAPVFSNKTICIGDTVSLDAGANDSTDVFWYASATSTMPVSFTSPLDVHPSVTTTYYAATRFSLPGRAGKPAFTSSVGSGVYNWGLMLDAVSDLFIDSMAIYPTGSGTVNISLLSCAGCASPSTLGSYSYTFSSASGTKVMVPVKSYLPKGNGYLMAATGLSGTLSLKRDFPYSGYPIVSTTSPLVVSSGWGNGATQYDGYYYYYDFVVKGEACESARMPVTISVDPKPNPSFTATRAGGTVTFKNRSTGGGTYFWDFGDGDTSSAESPVHTYKANGTYVLHMYQTNPCGIDSVIQTIVIVDLVGVPHIAGMSGLSLFPNPAGNTFTISFRSERAGNMRMMLYNSLGAQVMNEDIAVSGGPQAFTRDISRLPGGNYLLLLSVDGRQEALRLVISGR